MFNISFDNACYLLHCLCHICLLWFIKKIRKLFCQKFDKHMLKSMTFFIKTVEPLNYSSLRSSSESKYICVMNWSLNTICSVCVKVNVSLRSSYVHAPLRNNHQNGHLVDLIQVRKSRWSGSWILSGLLHTVVPFRNKPNPWSKLVHWFFDLDFFFSPTVFSILFWFPNLKLLSTGPQTLDLAP